MTYKEALNIGILTKDGWAHRNNLSSRTSTERSEPYIGASLYHVHKRRSLLDAERRLRLVDEQLLYHKRGGSNLYCI